MSARLFGKLKLWIKRAVSALLAVLLLLLLLAALDTSYSEQPSIGQLQLQAPVEAFDRVQDSLRYDSLLQAFGRHKILPKGYELQALAALSFYPQLKEVPISFVLTPALIPLASRPEPLTLFTPWGQRRYTVVISTESFEAMSPILLANMPYNAQIGVLGHELAHTVYYLDKSALAVIGIGARYVLGDFRKKFERNTDQRAIDYGLGFQLYAWSSHVEQAFARSQYRNSTFEGAYYSSAEIRAAIEQSARYSTKIR